MDRLINFEEIEKAHQRIKPYIHETPVLTNESINKLTGCDLYFKCENFQKVGAFKMRGAANAILSLTEKEKDRGVATHSSGNHAQAVALAAKKMGVEAYIVMPETAPKVKREAVLEYGAKVILCAPTLASRKITLADVVSETGATIIHPYEDINVITGQATATVELFLQQPQLDVIFTPIGGGGLISGTALAASYISPDTKIVGCEPTGANDALMSFAEGKIIEKNNPNSIADGLLSTIGAINFEVVKEYVDEIFTVEDKLIINSMKLIWERMKIIVEPSAAVPLAALFKNKDKFKGQKIGIIITGGNFDFSTMPLW